MDSQIVVNTEEKIKIAARKFFFAKGFAATRTRDIAKEADINLALLNYYFRSKQKLFDIIITETLSDFFKMVVVAFNNEKTSLEQKIENVVSLYIDLLLREPEIPMFLIGEIRSNSNDFVHKFAANIKLVDSVFYKQFQEAIQNGTHPDVNPIQFILNLMGLIIFPFLAKPMLQGVKQISDEEFKNLMLERKKLIPIWIKELSR